MDSGYCSECTVCHAHSPSCVVPRVAQAVTHALAPDGMIASDNLARQLIEEMRALGVAVRCDGDTERQPPQVAKVVPS